MSALTYLRAYDRDQALSNELSSELCSQGLLAYQTNVVRPPLLSETAEVVPTNLKCAKPVPLISVVILAGGLTIGSPASPLLASYNTLVSCRPTGAIYADIGDALQVGRLHGHLGCGSV